MDKHICIHGHFYQPPRENPWLNEVELQDSAYPYHDWNERITEECYAPNTASRILDHEGRIVDIVNLYSKISFNFGATLLSWLERQRPDVYQTIIDADAMSRERYSGHGSAIAQVYNHMIMPLANRRDKMTQALWGYRDFQRRFGRDPEGMWLPETAVDTETLEVLAGMGISYTILAPRQAKRVRPASSTEWIDVGSGSIDPGRAYFCRLPSGKNINLFFYDGPVSQDIAFGGMLSNGKDFANRLLGTFPKERDGAFLVHVATDGETYGHHHRGGEMALAYCLHHVESGDLAKLTNYGEFLENYPAEFEVEIIENSSWSCVHGVERWRKDCGCHVGANPQWSQKWREGLRSAMDWLRDRLAAFYEEEGGTLFLDPWKARDDYVDTLHDRRREEVDSFLDRHAKEGGLSPDEKARALKHLEIQKNALLIFTSCGWFFDEISGIETVQVMQYADQAVQYVLELGGENLEEGFVELLKKAKSNVYENGAEVYETMVKPARVDHMRVGAHYSISSVFEEFPRDTTVYAYRCVREKDREVVAGRVKLVTGRVRISSELTWDESDLAYAVLHLGDQNITGGVRPYQGEAPFVKMQDELGATLDSGDVMQVVRLIDRFFEKHTYSAWHLFKDEQRRMLNEVLALTYEGIEASYRQVYENHHALMNYLQSMKVPLPHPLLVAAEYVLDRELHNTLQEESLDVLRLEKIVGDIGHWSLKVDTAMAGYHATQQLNRIIDEFRLQINDSSKMGQARALIVLLRKIDVHPELWKVQNVFFSVSRKILPKMQSRADHGDAGARRWIDLFTELGSFLRVRID